MNDRATAVYEQDLAHQCAWETGGQRCHYPGSISGSTLGGGPWYCGAHSRCHNQADGMRIIVESMRPRTPTKARPQVATTDPIKVVHGRCMELLARLKISPPSNNWAHKLLAKARRGEKLMPIQIAKVAESLEMDPDDVGPHATPKHDTRVETREPGQEG